MEGRREWPISSWDFWNRGWISSLPSYPDRIQPLNDSEHESFMPVEAEHSRKYDDDEDDDRQDKGVKSSLSIWGLRYCDDQAINSVERRIAH